MRPLHLLNQAWNCVTSSIVFNCYRLAGFPQSDPAPQPQRKTSTLKSKTASPWLDVENIGLNPDIPEKFTTIDNDLETVSELTDDDIVEEI